MRETWRMTLSPEGSGSTTPDVAVPDAERDQVVAMLRSHCGDGTITLDEFADRVGIVFESATRAGLRTALEGLPITAAPVAGDAAPAPATVARRPTTSSVIGIM